MVSWRIQISDGNSGRKGYSQKEAYYYYDSYRTEQEAYDMGKKIKKERKGYGEKIKYFVITETEGRIYPTQVHRLYFNRRLRVI